MSKPPSVPNTSKMIQRAQELQHKPLEDHQSTSLGHFAVVSVGTSKFGIRSDMLKEVVPTPAITHLPGTPGWMNGLVQLRGSLLCAVDIGVLFDKRSSRELNYLVVLHHESKLLGLRVDAVLGFEEFFEQDLATKFENISKTSERPVQHVTKSLVSIIDVPRLLSTVNLSPTTMSAETAEGGAA